MVKITVLEDLNFDVWKNFTLENVYIQFPKIQTSDLLNWPKMALFGASKSPKLISRKIQVGDKS